MSTEMVQAIIAGRKTQTRRVMNPQPIIDEKSGFVYDFHHRNLYDIHDWKEKYAYDWSKWNSDDLLWMRESWNWVEGGLGSGWYIFKASEEDPDQLKWKPSIHMPKEAARIWADVSANVRIERVSEISWQDIEKEGIEVPPSDPLSKTHAELWRELWQRINGKPKAIYGRVAKRNRIIGYEVFPFDDFGAAEFRGLTKWRGKPLTVTVNPWVWVISFNVLGVDGKPLDLKC